MALSGDPICAERATGVSLRPAGAGDAAFIAGLLEAGFGMPATSGADMLHSAHRQTWIVEHGGEPVGTLSIRPDEGRGGIYGFVIDPARQGHGIGREALRQMCVRLRSDGVERIELEVEVQNERALTLYTTLDFVPVITEDYYSLPLA